MMAPESARAYVGASAAAIRHHYDVGNDFFALWLDPTRTYSCALWEGSTDTLQAAQERKLDYFAAQANCADARAVLDIGCGWGGLLRRLTDVHNVKRAVGLTLSAKQAEHVAGWDDERLDVRVQNWAEHTPAEPYDAIVSIGAFEHFAGFSMTRAARIAAYRHFFDCAHAWLEPGGRLAVQSNVKGNNVRMDRQTVRDLLFVVDHVFPQSELPWASELIEASERRFDIVSARNDPEHYERTCSEWLARLRDTRRQGEELVGAEMVRDYERYLSAAINAFKQRHLGLLRVVFERV